MATVKDILKKNKQMGSTAVTGVNYLENLSNPVTAANMVTPKTLSASTNGTVLNNVKQTAGDAVSSVKQGANTAKDFAVDTAQNVGNAATKFWNGVVDTASNAVSATGDALDKFGNTVGTYATNLFNGKEETTATAEPVTETPTENVPYMSNVGTANMMTDGEYLKAGKNQIDWTYDENINYAEQNRQEALRRAEEAKQSAKVEAEALFRQNAANYGIRGEQMLDQGLAGGGYSEFLEGKNMETRAANYARADANAYAEAQNAEAQYNEEVRQANLLRQQGEANLLEKRYEISEKLRAERDAKIAEIQGLARSEYYTLDQIKALWSVYADVYGDLTDAEFDALFGNIIGNSAKSRLKDFIDTYGLGNSEEDFKDMLMRHMGVSEQQAADMAAAAYAMSNKEQNAQNADILNEILAELQAGRLTTNGAKYRYEQETGKKIDENSEEYKLIVETANKHGSDEKNERRQQIMSAYTQYYAQVLSGQLSAAEADAMMKGHGYGGAVGDIAGGEVSNLFDYSEGFAKAEERYKRNRAPALIEFLLETYPSDGVNALDLLAGEGYTPEEIAKYKGLYFETTKNADGSVTYGARKTTITDDERISLVASAAAAIRSGSMDLESAKAELGLRGIELAQGSKEMNYLNTAYNEWLKADAAASADLALYFLMNNNLPVSRDAVKDYFVNTLHKDDAVAEEMLDSIFDASGKLVYQPSKTEGGTTGSTGTTVTDGKDITKMTVAEILQYLNDNNVDVGGEGGTVDYSVENIYNILKYNPDFTMSKEDFAKIYDKDGDGNIDEDVLAELHQPGGGSGGSKVETDENTFDWYVKLWEDGIGRELTPEEKAFLANDSVDGKTYNKPKDGTIKASHFDKVEYEKDTNQMDEILGTLNIWGNPLTKAQKDNIKAALQSSKPNVYIYSKAKLDELIKAEAANDAVGYIDTVWGDIEEQKIGTDGLTAILQREKERAKNDGEEAYTTKALQKLEGIFNGGVVTKSFTYNNNGGRKTYNKGDNFSVTDGNRVYRIESEGKVTSDSGTENDKKAVAFANNAANGIKNGEVFGYGSELYMKTEDNVVKIRARRLFGNGQYDELWKAVYGEQIQGLKDAAENDAENIGDYTGFGANVNEGADTKSSKKLGANLQNVADRENSFWEMLMGDGETPTGTATGEAATLTPTEKEKVVRGYAQAYAHSGNRYTVTVRGEEFKVGKLGNPLKTEGEYSAVNTNILKVASNLDDGEVFIYDKNLYTRQGNYVYPIEVSDSKKEKIKNLLSADGKYNFDRGGIYSDAAVPFDGSVKNLAEGATFSKKAGKNVTLTLGEGDDLKKYKFEIDAVLGNTTEAVKAAQAAGIKNNGVFAHHEDLYIYTVDESGNGKAYKLGARNGARNADYDAFKEAVTDKDISAENIFGNYKENLVQDNGGQGGGGDGNGDDPEIQDTTSTPVEIPKQETYTAKDVENYRQQYASNPGYIKKTFDQVAWGNFEMDDALKAAITPNDDGTYSWYVPKTLGNIPHERTDITVAYDKDDENKLTISYFNNNDEIVTREPKLVLEKVEKGDLVGLTSDKGTIFKNGDEYYLIDPKNNVYEITGGEDFEAIKGAKNGYLGGQSGGQNTPPGETVNWSDNEITKGNAQFESHGALFGINRNLKKGDNITVEVGGKSYAVESKGEVTDEAKLAAIVDDDFDDTGSPILQNNEVFKWGDGIYLKKIDSDGTVRYYEIGGRFLAGGKAEDLKNAIASNASKVPASDATATQNTKVTYGDYEDVEARDKITVEFNSYKYKVKAGSVYGPDSAAFKAASGYDKGDIYLYGGDLYMKRGNDAVKLVARNDDSGYKALKERVNSAAPAEASKLYAQKAGVGSNDITLYIGDDKKTYKLGKAESVGNGYLATEAAKFGAGDIFNYDGKVYYKVDANNVRTIEDMTSQEIANASSDKKPSFNDATKIKKTGLKNFGQKKNPDYFAAGGTMGNFSFSYDNKQSLLNPVSIAVGAPLTVQNGDTATTVGEITAVYPATKVLGEGVSLEGIEDGEYFVVDDVIYMLNKGDYGDNVCKVKITDETYKNQIKEAAKASSDGSEVQGSSVYRDGLGVTGGGKTAAASTSGGRGFNYSDMV